MAIPVSPQNDDSQNVNGLLPSSTHISVWNRAVDGTVMVPTGVTGGSAAAQLTGTHTQAEVFASTDPITLIAGYVGGTVYPLAAGTSATGTAATLHVREVGPAVSLVTHAISVATAATSIGTGITSSRKHIEIYNGGTQTVYLGPSAVSTANGFPLGTAGNAWFDSGHDWYAVTGGGTASLRVLEMS